MPSAAIKDDTDNPDIFRYFSNQSSTFVPGPPGLIRHKYAGVTFDGELVNDTVQIATLSVEDQPFINAAYAYASEIHFWMGYDGVLGLSPRWDTSGDDPEMPSPWSQMVQRGLLDHNLFAIDVPRIPGGEGELSLGNINQKYYNQKFRSIPLASDEKDKIWMVTANSLTWKNHTHPMHREFTENAKAIITADWYIALPAAWATRIHNDVKPLCGIAGPIFCEVECSAREHLPNFVLGLGSDNFTLTAYDYAPMRLDKDQREWCSFDVYSIEALFDGNDGAYSQATVVIGLPFLNAFYRLVLPLSGYVVSCTSC